jgi:transcription elongation GreA/GreB family factor
MSQSLQAPLLTKDGRNRLAERLRRLRDETLPELTVALDQSAQDPAVQADLDLASREVERLAHLLKSAGSITEIPEDPDVVQLGDWVTVRTDEGGTNRYLIVHPAEAAVDRQRISADTPLAVAALGRRVGDLVEIDAPGGRYRCRIVEVLRADA